VPAIKGEEGRIRKRLPQSESQGRKKNNQDLMMSKNKRIVKSRKERG